MSETPTPWNREAIGCVVDDRWGQYGVARMVEIAAQDGYPDARIVDLARRHLASMGASANYIGDEELEALYDAADAVEAWMTEHLAPAGCSFGWWEGDFFLQTTEWWEMEA